MSQWYIICNKYRKRWLGHMGLGFRSVIEHSLNTWGPGVAFLYYKTKMIGTPKFYSYLWKTFSFVWCFDSMAFPFWRVSTQRHSWQDCHGTFYVELELLHQTITFCFHKSKKSAWFLLMYSTIFWKILRLYLLVWIHGTLKIKLCLATEILKKKQQ